MTYEQLAWWLHFLGSYWLLWFVLLVTLVVVLGRKQ